MKHEQKRCPRCGAIFECKVGDVANCQCNIPLQIETRQFLAKSYYDCLCANCLKYFDDLILSYKEYTFPTKPEELIKGIHYYEEGSLWVFTEIYHFLRGYCCKSGCRHCVYGYRKK